VPRSAQGPWCAPRSESSHRCRGPGNPVSIRHRALSVDPLPLRERSGKPEGPDPRRHSATFSSPQRIAHGAARWLAGESRRRLRTRDPQAGDDRIWRAGARVPVAPVRPRRPGTMSINAIARRRSCAKRALWRFFLERGQPAKAPPCKSLPSRAGFGRAAAPRGSIPDEGLTWWAGMSSPPSARCQFCPRLLSSKGVFRPVLRGLCPETRDPRRRRSTGARRGERAGCGRGRPTVHSKPHFSPSTRRERLPPTPPRLPTEQRPVAEIAEGYPITAPAARASVGVKPFAPRTKLPEPNILSRGCPCRRACRFSAAA